MEKSLINHFETSKKLDKLTQKGEMIRMKKKIADEVYHLKIETMIHRLYLVNQSRIKANEEEQEYLNKEEQDQLDNLRIEIKWHANKMHELNKEEEENSKSFLNL